MHFTRCKLLFEVVIFVYKMDCSLTDMAVWLRADGYHNGVLRDKDNFLSQQEEAGFPQTGRSHERKRERQRHPTRHALGSRKGKTSSQIYTRVMAWIYNVKNFYLISLFNFYSVAMGCS